MSQLQDIVHKLITDTACPLSCWSKTEQDISIFHIKGSFTASESVEDMVLPSQ